jgi:hypothetical protein
VRLEGLGQLKKMHLIGTRTHYSSACSIVPQPTTLLRALNNLSYKIIKWLEHISNQHYDTFFIIVLSVYLNKAPQQNYLSLM